MVGSLREEAENTAPEGGEAQGLWSPVVWVRILALPRAVCVAFARTPTSLAHVSFIYKTGVTAVTVPTPQVGVRRK